MKTKRILAAILLLTTLNVAAKPALQCRLSSGFAAAKTEKVTLAKAGTLAEALGPHRLAIRELTVEGPIDKTDFQLMSELSQQGLLRKIDLTKTRIMRSGDNFDEQAGIFPSGVFAKSLLEDITLGDLSCVFGNSFKGLQAVRRIVFNGNLGHIDAGEPFNQCPRLREIVFNGTIFSTGGPTLAYDCASLERIVLNGLVVQIFLGEPADCPNFKGYEVNGPVVLSGQPDVIAPQPTPITKQKTLDKLHQAAEMVDESLPGDGFLMMIRSNAKYVLASAISTNGHRNIALSLLEEAAAEGFRDVSDMENAPYWEPLRQNERFQKAYAQIKANDQKWREENDFMLVLKKAGPYVQDETPLPDFTYASADDANLARVRQYFRLDSIAGTGDELSRIKNIMYWLHDEIRHDGGGGIPDVARNAIDLHRACKQEDRGLNCRGLAIILSELYLAMGWPARFVTCEPKAYATDSDCHVICMVWSHNLGKWLWMDPTFAAYVCDDEGTPLGIGEVRERLISDQPLVLNEDANWNHQSMQTIDRYLYQYMAKNLYYLSTYQHNGFQSEDFGNRKPGFGEKFITLAPTGRDYRDSKYITHDAQYFFSAPSIKK